MMTLKEIKEGIEELKALIRNADEATKKEIEYRLDDLNPSGCVLEGIFLVLSNLTLHITSQNQF